MYQPKQDNRVHLAVTKLRRLPNRSAFNYYVSRAKETADAGYHVNKNVGDIVGAISLRVGHDDIRAPLFSPVLPIPGRQTEISLERSRVSS